MTNGEGNNYLSQNASSGTLTALKNPWEHELESMERNPGLKYQ